MIQANPVTGVGMAGNGRRTVMKVGVVLIVLVGVMLGLGWLVTRAFVHDWPFTAEDGVDRSLATDRTPLLNHVSAFFSTMASTPYAIGLTLLAAVLARLVLHRWRETWFIVGVVALEAVVFLVTTLVIGRPRPLVSHLDLAPPTSSFPSGHTAAALALFGAVILVARRHGVPRPVWLLVLIPFAVGASRLYRGMHHPSDVVASLLLATACLVLMRRTVLPGAPVRASASAGRTR
jgi:membrane-associated phospholipid phosphatase